MLTLLIIVATLLMWAVFGPLAFVRNNDRVPMRHCPACDQSGRAIGIGRFKCSKCGHKFVLGFGQKATLPVVGVGGGLLLVFSLYAAFRIVRGDGVNFPAIV